LILDLLEANCPVDESISSRTMETLRFCDQASNVDTEAETSWSDRGVISQGEEIYEEEG